MNADKCQHCGATKHNEHSFRFVCGTNVNQVERGAVCYTTEIIAERAARQKAEKERDEARGELAAMKQDYSDLIDAAANNCKGCHGAGQDNDGEGYINEPCPDCAWIARVTPKRSQEIQEGDAKPTELEETRRKLEEWKEMASGLAKLVYRWSSHEDETVEVTESTRATLAAYRELKKGGAS